MKAIEVQVEKISSILQFTCVGKRSYDSYVQLIDLVVSELDKDKETKKVLIDLTKLTDDLSILERHTVGKYLAEKLPREIRIAVVSPRNYLVKMVENTAVNRGVKMFTTSDKEEAANWLEKSSDKY